ncbi:MAG: hypothetical protein AB9866_19030 [Syntrophobacteraceae bacterium]
MIRLPFTNSTISILRRTATTGNKKEDATLLSGIPAFISDTGTTADHEQTYLIMFETDGITEVLNSDTDSISDGTDTYKVANCVKKRFTYQIRAIKKL